MTRSKGVYAPKQPSREKSCATCGKTFLVKASRYERTTYCSRECKGTSFDRPCAICGKPFSVKPSQSATRLYCSYACRDTARLRTFVDNPPEVPAEEANFTCIECGRRGRSNPLTAHKRKFCSPACRYKHMARSNSGEGGANWQGGLKLIAKHIRNSATMRDWKRKVLEAAGCKCEECGGEAEDAHHIKALSDFLAEIFDPANGKALCIPCHATQPNHNENLVRSRRPRS